MDSKKINFTIRTVAEKETIEYSMTPQELVDAYIEQMETGHRTLPYSDDKVVRCEFCGTKLHILRFGQLFDIFTKALDKE